VIFPAGRARAYVCAEPVDMRKQIDGLAAMVSPVLQQDPFGGHLFVFVSKSRTKVKILWWDRNGFCLWYKRVERGRFPAIDTLGTQGLALSELSLWLEGIDLSRTHRFTSVPAMRVI
jgi:transposase